MDERLVNIKAIGEVKRIFPRLGTSKIKARKDGWGDLFVKLSRLGKKAVEYQVLQDGKLSKSAKGNNPPPTLIDALGPYAGEILTDNESSIATSRERVQQFMAKNKDEDGAQKVNVILQRRLNQALKERDDIRREAA